GPAADDPLVQAVEAASRAGIIVVVSAGNVGVNPATNQVGYGGILVPGNAPSAFTVASAKTHGTVDPDDDLVANYSSRGPAWHDANGVVYDRLSQGAGRVNGAGVLNLTRSVDPGVPAGDPWIIAPVVPYSVYNGVIVPWAQNIVWGENVVWGENIINANNIV